MDEAELRAIRKTRFWVQKVERITETRFEVLYHNAALGYNLVLVLQCSDELAAYKHAENAFDVWTGLELLNERIRDKAEE